MASHVSIPVEALAVIPADKLTEFQKLVSWFASFSGSGTRLDPDVKAQLRELGMLGTPPAILEEYDRMMTEDLIVTMHRRTLLDVDSSRRHRDILWRRLSNVEAMLETALVIMDSWSPLPEVMRSGVRQILSHARSTVMAQFGEAGGVTAQRYIREPVQWVSLTSFPSDVISPPTPYRYTLCFLGFYSYSCRNRGRRKHLFRRW